MELVKYHAQGNDYLVSESGPYEVNDLLVAQLCDRRKGLGADGLLVGPYTDDSTPLVRIFNSDGTETRKSGNGVCIFARFLVDTGFAPRDQPFAVRTLSGPVEIQSVDSATGRVCTTMGSYSMTSSNIPMTGPARRVIDEPLEVGNCSVRISCVSFGNPHCVVFVPKADQALAEALGPKISSHPSFIEGTNVQFVELLDRGSISIQIWERGSGYTLSSGSSSCAAVCAAVASGYLDPNVTVVAPGGKLTVEVHPDGEVLLETIVTPVFKAHTLLPSL